jgi:DNA polymerase
MRWTERQRAMLREIGVPPFWPVEDAPAADATPEAATTAAANAARPVSLARAAAEAMSSLQEAASLPASLPATEPASRAAQAPSPGPSQGAVQGAAQGGPRTTSAAPAARSGQPAPSGLPTRSAPAVEVVLGPRPVGIETMDWPALREAVAGCQACGLCQSRKNPVFGVGNEQARWMIVGEAPGEQEDRQGEPFVGRAGQLLDRMLASLDLTRSEDEAERQVFIANVLKCRPPANRNPQPQEVAQCEPFLLRQVALVQPKVIVAMGRFAVQSLLKSTEAIGRLRGHVHDLAGVPLIVTYHPAYLLRNPADKALAWDDLCLAREVMRRRA